MPRKIVSRFPKISEKFLLEEILDLQRRGFDTEVFSLLKEQECKVHAEAASSKGKMHHAPVHDWSFWAAQLHWLSHRPSIYVRSWWKATRGNLCSITFLIRELFVVPVAAYFAPLLKAGKIDHLHAYGKAC